jgi:hypothetical protein
MPLAPAARHAISRLEIDTCRKRSPRAAAAPSTVDRYPGFSLASSHGRHGATFAGQIAPKRPSSEWPLTPRSPAPPQHCLAGPVRLAAHPLPSSSRTRRPQPRQRDVDSVDSGRVQKRRLFLQLPSTRALTRSLVAAAKRMSAIGWLRACRHRGPSCAALRASHGARHLWRPSSVCSFTAPRAGHPPTQVWVQGTSEWNLGRKR